jgi:GWxTD domain-containing protein
MIKRLATALFALASLAGMASAQRYSQDNRTYFDFGDPYYCSLIQSADGKSADILINTSSALFSFLKTSKAADQKHGNYYAVRDVTIEVVDRGTNDVLSTKSALDTIYVNDYNSSISRDSWHTMRRGIEMPNTHSERLGVRVGIRDGILNRDVMRPVVAEIHSTHYDPSAGDSNGIEFGELMLFDSLRAGKGTMAVRGNRFMFSRDIPGSVSFRLSPELAAEHPVVELTVRQATNTAVPTDIGDRAKMTLEISDMHPASEMHFSTVDSMVTYTLVPSHDSESWTAFFNVPGVAFEQGKYEFAARIVAGNAEKRMTQNFQLVWQNMPLSLDDPEDAIAPLVHILPADQVAEINSGSKDAMRGKLNQYWKTKDPTPGTAYNERMAEFYKRVDYADFNFPSGHMLDGAMTDRGKIYLLYGAPQNVERTLLPGESPTELWSYGNNIKRSFRFEDRTGGGHYELVDVQNLASAN